jgi:hypothetical protein
LFSVVLIYAVRGFQDAYSDRNASGPARLFNPSSGTRLRNEVQNSDSKLGRNQGTFDANFWFACAPVMAIPADDGQTAIGRNDMRDGVVNYDQTSNTPNLNMVTASRSRPPLGPIADRPQASRPSPGQQRSDELARSFHLPPKAPNRDAAM